MSPLISRAAVGVVDASVTKIGDGQATAPKQWSVHDFEQRSKARASVKVKAEDVKVSQGPRDANLTYGTEQPISPKSVTLHRLDATAEGLFRACGGEETKGRSPHGGRWRG